MIHEFKITIARGQVWTPADENKPPRIVTAVEPNRVEYQRGNVRGAMLPSQFAAWVLMTEATTPEMRELK